MKVPIVHFITPFHYMHQNNRLFLSDTVSKGVPTLMRNVFRFVAILIIFTAFIFAFEDGSNQEPPKANEFLEKKQLALDPKSNEVLSNTPKMEPMDIPLINQMDAPRLYNGCEVSSLAMILNYQGYDVTKNELADKVKQVPLTYDNGLKGNPNDGFVGDMVDGPGLSVYHGPMHDLAKKYAGEKAKDITGSSVDKLYGYLLEGLPVWIITTTNLAPVKNLKSWDTPKGEIEITFQVHSVAVTGVDEDFVYVNNPYGQKNQKVDKKKFEAAWNQMGSQAIVIEK